MVDGAASLLEGHLAVVARAAVEPGTCSRWVHGVLGARDQWTSDFGGEQFCLGRAFYTHLETDRTGAYFEDATPSNERVERNAPGLQGALRAMMARAVGVRVTPRPDWCGAGVHVFPRGGRVARRGGVVHFDTEGLSGPHVARRKNALSLVAMLQPPTRGGGLRFWPIRYEGEGHVDAAMRRARRDARVTLDAGDVVLFDSYRLHQIERFDGLRHRISATLHAAELSLGVWESWF
jgi:hypothetical protein